ncbi:hypothetical protein BAY61_07255 [Prauserella marina]|nr:hypothetical protein BAY61_07255 [Prauserella marina]
MATAAVLMPPAVVPRQQLVDRREQIVVAARSGLQYRETGGGVRNPDVQESFVGSRFAEEAFRVLREVEHDGVTAGAHLDLGRVHTRNRSRVGDRRDRSGRRSAYSMQYCSAMTAPTRKATFVT